jgi:thiaminase/transcriptional activator TenA
VPAADGLSARLRRGVDALWGRLERHPFVLGMADGTLPPERYLFYVEQNLLYLPAYARAIALGVAKTRDSVSLQAFTDSLTNIVQVEIPQNEALRDRVRDLVPTAPPGEPVMAPATLAYSSYLLAVAAQGDIREIRTVILPCAWSYGDIARGLVDTAVAHPVYHAWISFFASADYAALVARMRVAYDAELADYTPAEEERLAGIFTTATRLEYEFWQMGYQARQWDDLTPTTRTR